MRNIQEMKNKPMDNSEQDQMDRDVGMMFRKLHEVEKLLIRIIVTTDSVDKNEVTRRVEAWYASKESFGKLLHDYKVSGIKEDRISAMNQIREDRNYFAHRYSGKKDERGRLKTLLENIDGTIGYLKAVDQEVSAKLKKRENEARNNLRSEILRAAKQCKVDGMGLVRLADVGNNLGKQGIKCKSLKKKCEELDICVYHYEQAFNTNGRAQIYYIKPNGK